LLSTSFTAAAAAAAPSVICILVPYLLVLLTVHWLQWGLTIDSFLLRACTIYSPRGTAFAALARFGWSSLSLDDVLLGRRSLLQEAASSTLKVKKEGKM
jgi:hypothetical protein